MKDMLNRREMILGENIQKIRNKKEFTQDNLADLLEIDRASISRYENGKNVMGIDVFMRFCNALESSPNELLLQEEEWKSFEKYRELSKNNKKLIDDMIDKLFLLEKKVA